MRLLLTSAGISTTSIHDALLDLQGKPIAQASTLFVSTAIYAILVRGHSLLASGILECRCRAFNPQGLSGIELDQEKVTLYCERLRRAILGPPWPLGPARIRRRSRIRFEASIIRFHFLEAPGHSAL